MVIFSGPGIRAACWPSAAFLQESGQLNDSGWGGQEAGKQQLWRRPGAGVAALQTGRTPSKVKPVASFWAGSSDNIFSVDNVSRWFLQGDVVTVTFVAGNPRQSGDIVR